MPSHQDQSRQTKHEQLIAQHQELLQKYYQTALQEDEDTDLSHEIAQISSLITSYKELAGIKMSDL